MNLTWCTDIHLDCLSTEARLSFINTLESSLGEAILLTGDITTGTQIVETLEFFADKLSKPLYFVLGNHDFYDCSIQKVRTQVSNLAQQYSNLFFLDETPPILLSTSEAPLESKCILIGHTGWGDARNGDFLQTPVRINDHRKIEELSNLSREALQQRLQQLGKLSASWIQKQAQLAIESQATHILVATHVPPFPEAAWYEQYAGAIDWIPDFTCKAVGDVLHELATKYTHIQWSVYCGHGHHAGVAQITANLMVYTGSAEYGAPKIEGFIRI